MNKIFILLFLCTPIILFAQEKKDSTNVFKKRVLENTEIDILTSFYTQKGKNASVTGGIGSEKLNDYATNISVSIPLNDDDILTITGKISAYTSASSNNTNPFNRTGADKQYEGDDEGGGVFNFGSPWVELSGASITDVWSSGSVNFSHSSDDRNTILNANASVSYEFDYFSIGFGGGITKLFNQKNTEIGVNASAFIDQWRPVYPIEIWANNNVAGNLNNGFFSAIDILDANGVPIDKNGVDIWQPINNSLIKDKGRNTYVLSLNFSQILNKNAQISFTTDITYQNGWLANPQNRVYFADKDNFFIGNPLSIPNYTSSVNQDVFQMADDIERLPDSRLKIPIGVRFNYYINEFLVVRTYYRYYFDDWGINSNTFNIELPIKIGDKFTLYPNYRFYNQTAADYFGAFDQLLSTNNFYTSDYDLSKFNSNQFGFGIKYTDILTNGHIWKFGLKSMTLNYNYYNRNNGLKAHIVTTGVKFILDK